MQYSPLNCSAAARYKKRGTDVERQFLCDEVMVVARPATLLLLCGAVILSAQVKADTTVVCTRVALLVGGTCVPPKCPLITRYVQCNSYRVHAFSARKQLSY